MDCKSCKQRLRADKIVEEYMETSKDTELPANWAAESTPADDMMNYIKKK